MRKNLLFSLLLGMCWPAFSLAQSQIDAFNLEDLLNIQVTTATKKAIKLEETPGSITVITRQQMLDTNARTLRDVLNVFVPGMDVVPTYFRYGDRVSEGIYSRGLLSDFSQQVLFLLNGQGKFNETTFSSAYPAIEFTLENVERVEISRTPIPLYGGSAITIINIITREQFLKDTTELFMNTSVTDASSFKYEPVQGRRFSAVMGRTIKEWHFGGSVQTYSDSGQEHPNEDLDGGYQYDPSTLKDGTKAASNASMTLKSPDEKWFIQANYKDINQDAFLSGGVPSQNTDIYNYRGIHFIGNVKYKPDSSTEILLGAMRSVFINFIDYPTFGPYGSEQKNFDLFVEANKNIEFGQHSWLNGVKIESEGQHDGTVYYYEPDGGLARSGYGVYKDENLILAPNASRSVYSFYSEDTWKPSAKTTVVAGARFDHYNGFLTKNYDLINPRLAVSYVASSNWILKGTYASASRPPSIYEQSGVNLVYLVGSPDMKPENIQTAELSAIYQRGGMKTQITPFYQVFKDKIEYVDNGAGTQVATNNGDTNVTGVDLDIQYYMSKRSYIFLNTSFFKSEDQETDKDTNFLPNTYVNGGINYNHKSWNYNLTAFYRGERELSDAMPVNKDKATDPHLNANLSVTYNVTDALGIYTLIENVSDQENVVPLAWDGLAVPLKGRTYHLGLRWAL